MRFEYLKLCLEDPEALRMLQAVVERLANAQVPGAVVEAMRMSSLTALKKANGKVRGIACGDVLRRLAAKTLARMKQDVFRRRVEPSNFGLATSCGTDGLGILVRAFLDSNPNATVLSIDGVGAFDHVRRATIFAELMADNELADLVPFVRMWYQDVSHFLWADEDGAIHDIAQADGGEQGDALMPDLFCLALRPALQAVKAQLRPGEIVVAYLDDVYVLVPDPDRAGAVHDIVKQALQEICGIDVHLGKLAAYNRSSSAAPRSVAALGPHVWRADLDPARQGITVVGTPIGTDEYVAARAEERLQEEDVLLGSICQMESLQAAWLLLYFCAVPRANHLLRAVPPSQAAGYAEAHDNRILTAFRQLLGLTRQPGQGCVESVPWELWSRQAQLPIRLGGCGLRCSSRISPAAYWASWADCLSTLSRSFPAFGAYMSEQLQAAELGARDALPRCVRELFAAAATLDAAGFSRPTWHDVRQGVRPATPNEDELTPGEWRHGWQFYASDACEQHESRLLLRAFAVHGRQLGIQGTAPDRARLHSCAGPHAGSWLTVAPTSPALQLANDEISCALRRRVGLATGAELAQCEGCGRNLDAFGHHRCNCTRTGRNHARHRGVLGAWRQVFAESGNAVARRNVERLLRNTHVPVSGSDNRRLDLVVPTTSVARGVPLFCDVTVVSPITGRGLARPGCTEQPGGALRAASRSNDLTYREVISSGLGRLCALDVETYGRWGADPRWLIPALARERARGLPVQVRRGLQIRMQSRWWGLLSVAVQRCVAHACMRNTGADLGADIGEPVPFLGNLPSC
jgi:hypothetical protein